MEPINVIDTTNKVVWSMRLPAFGLILIDWLNDGQCGQVKPAADWLQPSTRCMTFESFEIMAGRRYDPNLAQFVADRINHNGRDLTDAQEVAR